ncbi:hypothetical protein Lesp02_83890 [Lentzea sp. NBRC 105346]|uniref:hypothetical protein n=1 Tax=Lentzea sp. NBRC 105346 TaxID=3032205 RepID=UPI0024A199C8|nr:hypothetical protein [Lentzea sp. NBRC 105346]GLZ36202.1 hypothetical protein Lesp02_83890 [Lentzea sp. NBRC 105346]
MSIGEVRAALQAAQTLIVDQYGVAGDVLGFVSEDIEPMIGAALRGSGRPEAEEIARASSTIVVAARDLHQALGYTMGLIERFLAEL